MDKPQLLMLLLKITWVLFAFAYGACLGSLSNVIAYRVPKGLSIVRPPSRCPKCDTKLSWRDNIPVLGWIALKGKCRYCKNRISPEYPIVEAAFGLLFVVFLVIWYMLPPSYQITPRWAALNQAETTWPEFVVLLFLLASLFAMTLVDAKSFTIPIWLTWFPAAIAVIVHPLHAAWLSRNPFPPRTQIGWSWAIATPGPDGWAWVWLSIGGIVGLGLGLLLLRLGLIGRSFSDYAEWEAKAKAEQAASQPAADAAASNANPTTPALASPAPDAAPAPDSTPAPNAATPSESSPHMWMDYPHARREMVRELAFLAPCTLLMLAGWHWGQTWTGTVPLWLDALAGVLMGYLIGGGIVWAVRIFGSFAFGKEAMGMGDVHLMAAVGACLGWIDSALGFFGAAFVGLGWAVLGRMAGGRFKRMLPYGPFLAVSTVLVLLCKPLIEQGLAILTHGPVHLP